MIIFKIMKRYIILKHIPYYLQVPIFIYLVFSNIPFLQSLIAQDFLTIKKKIQRQADLIIKKYHTC